MNNCDHIYHYFPELNLEQRHLLNRFAAIFEAKNREVNLISRKDIDQLCVRHILHSLAIFKLFKFQKGTKVLDVGTGGGFPGIPLAVVFPEISFLLIDSVGKKIRAVKNMIEELNLKNVEVEQIRVEDLKSEFDIIVSRAVTALPKFCEWVEGKIRKKSVNSFENGILYLKGGYVAEEINQTKMKSKVWELHTLFDEEFFETKKLIHLFR